MAQEKLSLIIINGLESKKKKFEKSQYSFKLEEGAYASIGRNDWCLYVTMDPTKVCYKKGSKKKVFDINKLPKALLRQYQVLFEMVESMRRKTVKFVLKVQTREFIKCEITLAESFKFIFNNFTLLLKSVNHTALKLIFHNNENDVRTIPFKYNNYKKDCLNINQYNSKDLQMVISIVYDLISIYHKKLKDVYKNKNGLINVEVPESHINKIKKDSNIYSDNNKKFNIGLNEDSFNQYESSDNASNINLSDDNHVNNNKIELKPENIQKDKENLLSAIAEKNADGKGESTLSTFNSGGSTTFGSLKLENESCISMVKKLKRRPEGKKKINEKWSVHMLKDGVVVNTADNSQVFTQDGDSIYFKKGDEVRCVESITDISHESIKSTIKSACKATFAAITMKKVKEQEMQNNLKKKIFSSEIQQQKTLF